MDQEQKKQYNIVKNLIYSTVSTLTTFFLFILLSFVGRYLGKTEYGIFTTALSLATIFEIFTDIGLSTLSVRNVAREKNLTGKYIGNLLSLKIILCVIVYGFMMLIVNIMDYDFRAKVVIYMMTLSSLLKNMKSTFRLFFQANDKFNWDTILVIFERTVLLAICFAALIQWRALLPLVICFVAIRLVDFLMILVVIHYQIAPVRIQCDLQFIKKLQLDALPLGLFYIILTVFAHVDTVMLSLMRGFADVGLYNAAAKIYEGTNIIPTIFWLVFLPRLSELFVTDKSHHQRLAIRSVKYMYIVGIPILTYGILLSQFLVTFFFKGEYIAAIPALQIMFLGIAFDYPNWMMMTTLISMNKQRVMMFISLAVLGFKVLLNFILIPIYGFNGSAVAMVLASVAIFISAATYLYQHQIKLPILKLALKPIFASAVVFLVFEYLNSAPMILLLGTTVVIYGIVMIVTKIFDQDEISGIYKNLQLMVKK